jgi:hypothetical protein
LGLAADEITAISTNFPGGERPQTSTSSIKVRARSMSGARVSVARRLLSAIQLP